MKILINNINKIIAEKELRTLSIAKSQEIENLEFTEVFKIIKSNLDLSQIKLIFC